MILQLAGRVLGHPRRLRAQIRSAWRWCRQHPRRSAVFLAVGLWLGQIIFGNLVFAYADPGNELIAALGATDSSGVPLESYDLLPIDRGDVMTPQKGIYGVLTDFLWVGHMVSITIALNVLTLLLEFEWIDWLLAPVVAWAGLLKQQFEGLEWVPFALGISAFVGSMAMWFGKRAAGLMDIIISVACGIAAVGMLANPLVNMQGTEGAFATVRSWGAEIAVAVVEDTGSEGSTGAVVDLDDDSGAEAKSALSTVVIAEIVDIFVRQPAQSVTFGKTLDETCNAEFTEVMTSSPPSLQNNDVRSKISSCDEEAKNYVENPSVWQPLAAYLSSAGSIALWSLIGVLCVLFIWRVLSTIWAGIRTMIWVNIAVLPAIGRPQLGRAITDMVLGLVSVVFMLVLLSGSLAMTLSIARSLAAAGLDVLLQLMMIGTFTFIITIGLIVATIAMRKQGKTWGSLLGKLGLGKDSADGTGLHPVQVLDMGVRAVESTARMAKKFSNSRTPPSADTPDPSTEISAPAEQEIAPSTTAPVPSRRRGDEPPSSVQDVPGSDSPTPRDSASVEEPNGEKAKDIARGAAEAGKVVYRLAKAAPGGWGAIGAESGKIAAEKIVTKGVQSRNKSGAPGDPIPSQQVRTAEDGLPDVRVTTHAPERLTLGSSVESPRGNRVEVGNDGRGKLVQGGNERPAASTVRPSRPRSAASEARIASFRKQYASPTSAPVAAPPRVPAAPVRHLR